MLEAEQKLLFARGPGYVGPRADGARMPATITRWPGATTRRCWCATTGGVELLSNICRHRQAIMLDGRGIAPNIVCPIHRWTYDLNGELLGAPHFAEQPCVKLRSTPLQTLERPAVRRRARRRVRPGRHARRERARFLGLRARPHRNPRVQLQLEDLHRGLSRGLPRRAVPSGARPVRHLRRPGWQFGDRYSLQTVGVNNALAKPGTKTLRALAQGGARLLPAARCRRTARSG